MGTKFKSWINSNFFNKHIVNYLLIYIFLGGIYGLVQYFLVCIDITSSECLFNEEKLISFLTIVAYIVTPLVALYIYDGWKDQSNFELKQKVILQTNDLLRKISTILHRNYSLYMRIMQDNQFNVNYEFRIDLEENESLRIYNNELVSLLKEIYYLTNKDKNYILFREKYAKHVEKMSVYLKDVYDIKYTKKEVGQNRNKEISEYLSCFYEFEYFSNLTEDEKPKDIVKCMYRKVDLFNKSYDIQNDITNYILKKDFRI